MNDIHIYTDGACAGNPGPGGWGVVLIAGNRYKDLCGGSAKDTTNNRMELQAAIEGLKALKIKDWPVHLYTDSKYVVQGITEWIIEWKQHKWAKIANKDLWLELDALNQQFDNIEWRWLKGHAGHPLNERADKLAQKGLERQIYGERGYGLDPP